MSIFMDRDPSTVWLADLIEATEVVAASAVPCDPAIVKAFSHRLELRADVRPQSALSRWPVAELDQGEEPQPSCDEQG
jgi:hypothetical protein